MTELSDASHQPSADSFPGAPGRAVSPGAPGRAASLCVDAPRRGVVLVAHGSRDPRAARATERLAASVRALHPDWDVRASYLDHSVPRPRQVLASFAAAGHARAVMVPLLLTSAYHGRVDVPGEITAARAAGVQLDVELTEVLGPVAGQVPALLLDGLAARLHEAQSVAEEWDPARRAPACRVSGVAESAMRTAVEGAAGVAGSAVRTTVERAGGVAGSAVRMAVEGAAGVAARVVGRAAVDGVVLTAAGTRSASARATVEAAAVALGERLGVPCRVAYASAAPPLAGEAVHALRAAGCRRIGLSSYFLAPGLLWDATVASALEAGVAVVAEPLTDSSALAALVADRVTAGECVSRLGAVA